MPHAAPQAGIRKKTSPAVFARCEVARPIAAARAPRHALPTAAVLATALAASLLVTVGCNGTDGADDDVTAERHVRRPARPVERDLATPPTGSVVTIASTAPTTAPTPVPIALGGAVAPVMPPPAPVPTVTATPPKPPTPVSSIGTPAPHAMPGGAKAVMPETI